MLEKGSRSSQCTIDRKKLAGESSLDDGERGYQRGGPKRGARRAGQFGGGKQEERVRNARPSRHLEKARKIV